MEPAHSSSLTRGGSVRGPSTLQVGSGGEKRPSMGRAGGKAGISAGGQIQIHFRCPHQCERINSWHSGLPCGTLWRMQPCGRPVLSSRWTLKLQSGLSRKDAHRVEP
eukprot:1230986-Amphidinium_carterae.3